VISTLARDPAFFWIYRRIREKSRRGSAHLITTCEKCLLLGALRMLQSEIIARSPVLLSLYEEY